jgi:hypothetical protein
MTIAGSISQKYHDVANYFRGQDASKTFNNDAQVESRDTYQEGEKKDITFAQLGKGLVGAVAGAVSDGVAFTGVATKNIFLGVPTLYSALYHAGSIGPVLKTVVGAVAIPICALASPLAGLAGGILYGGFKGADNGVHKGFGAIATGIKDDVKWLNKETSTKEGSTFSNLCKDIAESKPKPGEEPFDISPVQAGKAVIGGVVGGVGTGVGAAAITAFRTPQMFYRANRSIWNDKDWGTKYKVLGSAGTLVAAAGATPLMTAVGTVWGSAKGAENAYKKGFGAVIDDIDATLHFYDKFLRESFNR